MFRIFKIIAVSFLLLAIVTKSLSAEETTLVHKLEFTTPDSLKLTGWLTPGSYNPPAPLIILLHQYQSDHTSYDYFLNELNRQYIKDTLHQLQPYPHTLSFDLRGHGLSTHKGSKTVDYQDRDESEMTKIPSDVAFAIKKVLADTTLPIDTAHIYVIGASIGANAAIMLTEELPFVAKTVLLSPGKKYLGMEPAESLTKFEGKTLIYASSGDSYSFNSSIELTELGGTKAELRNFRGNLHGTEILNQHPTAVLYLIDWLLNKKNSE